MMEGEAAAYPSISSKRGRFFASPDRTLLRRFGLHDGEPPRETLPAGIKSLAQ